MQADPYKDFGAILSDYEFFESHSTEASEDAGAFVQSVRRLAKGSGPVRMLDLGCGSGRFTEVFLNELGIAAARLKLTIVEPVFESLKTASERVESFSDQPIDARYETGVKPGDRFDLVLANHVFYYIPDPGRAIRELLASLNAGGVMLISMADRANFLVRIWEKCFSAIGMKIPYSVSEEVRSILDSSRADFSSGRVSYELCFPDSEENRLKICRFLMGEYFQRVQIKTMIDAFRGFEVGQDVKVTIAHDHYVVRN